MRADADPTDTERGTERIEAFSDGVFAIAITLLILDIRVPGHSELVATRGLFGALLALWPSYFAYVLSFVLIGIYWANHHYIFKLFTKTNHALNLLNLLFLLTIAFLPFPTATLGRFLLATAAQKAAAAFYALGLLLPALTWFFVWRYAVRSGLIAEHIARPYLRRLTLQYAASIAVYIVAFLVTLADFEIGLGLCTGFTLLYLLPPSFLAARCKR